MFNSYVVISCHFLAGHSNHSRLRPAHPKPSCWLRRPMVSAKARFVAHSELKDPNFNSKIFIKYQKLYWVVFWGSQPRSINVIQCRSLSCLVLLRFSVSWCPLNSISQKSGGPRAQRKMPRLRTKTRTTKQGALRLKETVAPSKVRHNIPWCCARKAGRD